MVDYINLSLLFTTPLRFGIHQGMSHVLLKIMKTVIIKH